MQSLRLSLQHILAHNYKVIFKITDRYTHTEIGLCEHICKVYPKHAMRAKLGISKQRKIYDIYMRIGTSLCFKALASCFSLRLVRRFLAASDRRVNQLFFMSLLSSGGIYFLAPELGPSCPSSEANSPHRGGAGPDSGEHKASSSSSPDGQPHMKLWTGRPRIWFAPLRNF